MSPDAPRSRATRASFLRLTPVLAPAPLTLLPDRLWTDAEWDRIQLGVRGRSMDEKWHVFTEDETAFLHRSWTGNGMYEVTFAPVAGAGEPGGSGGTGGGWRIVAANVETDPERYRSRGEEFEALMIELVLGSIVLGEPSPKLWARYKKLLPLTPKDRAPGDNA